MEKITLKGLDPLLLHDVLEPEALTTADLQAELYLPDASGGGSHPAVVVLDGLGGPKGSRERDYGRRLAAEGYVAIVLDSFATRGVGESGDLKRAIAVSEAMMLADAFAALDHLATRPDVDRSRIALMGFSYGGMISVLASYEQIARLFLPHGPRFRTHLSYYGCSIPRLDDPATTGAPVTLLLGEYDRNVSIPRSEAIAGDLRLGGSPVEMRVFERVYHQWDGSDETKRFFPFNLRRLRFRVGRDAEVRDERTGLRITGRASRVGLIALWTDPTGYSMLRDEEIAKRTDEILLAALAAM
jgi:dienelactone hydrolase